MVTRSTSTRREGVIPKGEPIEATRAGGAYQASHNNDGWRQQFQPRLTPTPKTLDGIIASRTSRISNPSRIIFFIACGLILQ
jgi:hypothetical protein